MRARSSITSASTLPSITFMYAQANEIVSERYGEAGDIHTFFMSALYAEAQECISGSEDASSF